MIGWNNLIFNKNINMFQNSIIKQIELTEELIGFLKKLQDNLSGAIVSYDRILGKMEAEQMLIELLEKQRNEYFLVTKGNIEELINMIDASDIPLAAELIDWLEDLLNT